MGKIDVYDKIMMKNRKKEQNVVIKRNFYINIHLGMEFTS